MRATEIGPGACSARGAAAGVAARRKIIAVVYMLGLLLSRSAKENREQPRSRAAKGLDPDGSALGSVPSRSRDGRTENGSRIQKNQRPPVAAAAGTLTSPMSISLSQ